MLPDGATFKGTGAFMDVSSGGYKRQAVSWTPVSELKEPNSAEVLVGMVHEAAAAVPRTPIEEALNYMRALLVEKGQQYSDEGDFNNFLRTSEMSGIPMWQVFRSDIGKKLARQWTQRQRGFDDLDSITDICGYAILWFAYELYQRSLMEDEHV